ncbi:MAG: D-alanine--D-alanine ligase [bacterium]|nr:D-alanine--D-alanine ligase [bacterium]MDE0418214.1 D-alanine--D-alanine ligase [bacterium]
MSRRVAVLMGGWSAEREVSLVTGERCADALGAGGHQVTCIDVDRDIAQRLRALDPPPEVVFNALHGRFGEDGCIQGLLETMGLPYTHSGPLASALAMDKPMAKRFFVSAGIPCPEGRTAHRTEAGLPAGWQKPFVVKPGCEGSSVGVRRVLAECNDDRLRDSDFRYGDDVMIEAYIPGRELTVSVLGERALGVTEVLTSEGFYDYRNKYTAGRSQHILPAPVPDEVAARAMEMALAAHRLLGCRAVSRADFRYDDTGGEPGDLYLLEINTQPGMTPVSLYPEQAAHAGIGFEELMCRITEQARCER